MSRGTIEGFNLIAALHSLVYGIAVYLLDSIDDYDVVFNDIIKGIFVCTINIKGTTITNIYKPPNISWQRNVLHVYPDPCLYIGDMNSHHTICGYRSNDFNGENLFDWINNNQFELVYDARDKKTFFSKVHKTESNPDLCIVSPSLFKNNKTKRKVLHDFPRSQHRPFIINVGLSIHLVIPKPRWNFSRANWSNFSDEIENVVDKIPVNIKNYDRFIKFIIKIGKKHIPRGFRKRYIPGWDQECEKLHNDFQENPNSVKADALLSILNENRKEKWINLTENIDFTNSARKSWSFLRKMGTSNVIKNSNNQITANQVASRLIQLTKAPMDQISLKEMKRNLKHTINNLPLDSPLSDAFTMEELDAAIKTMKIGKAAGIDGLYMEFIKNLKIKARSWLLKFYDLIQKNDQLLKIFKLAKIIAIVKPGKHGREPCDYRQISLLSIGYKILERLILN